MLYSEENKRKLLQLVGKNINYYRYHCNNYKILNENIPYQHPKNLNTKCLDNVSEKMLKIKEEKKKIIKNC